MQRREELNCCLFPFIERHIRFETKFLMKGEIHHEKQNCYDETL